MTNLVTRTARCGCGSLEAKTEGEPARSLLCSCRSCQERTGSGIGISVYWPEDQITLSGAATEWVRDCQGGRKATNRFCPVCGTTLWWTMEVFPGLVGVAGGAFSDSNFIHPDKAYWASLRPAWVDRIATVETLERQST